MGPRFFFELFLPSKYCCNWARLASVGPDPHATVLQDLLHTNHAATAAAAEDLYEASNLDFKRTDVDLQPRVQQMQQAERKRQVGQMGEGKRRTWRGRRPWASRCFCAAAATLQRCGRLHLQREDSLFCRVHQRAAGATPAPRSVAQLTTRARLGSPTTVVGSLNTRARAPRFSHDSAPRMTGYLLRQLRRRCLRLIVFCC
jgi:hypothetical protein